jgi:hypothetical protein
MTNDKKPNAAIVSCPDGHDLEISSEMNGKLPFWNANGEIGSAYQSWKPPYIEFHQSRVYIPGSMGLTKSRLLVAYINLNRSRWKTGLTAISTISIEITPADETMNAHRNN